MDKQNVTLSIPKELLRKAKILAVEQNTSLSGLLTETLTDIVARADEYAKAGERHPARLEQEFDLGTEGRAGWSREELHER